MDHIDPTRSQVPNTGAGWYPDPTQQHASRWWNGSTWTEQVVAHDIPAAAMPADSTSAAARLKAVDRAKRGAAITLIGGALMAVGALLPWEQVSANGMTILSEKGTSVGSGVTVLVSGGVIALLGFLFLNGTVKRKSSVATLALSIIGFVLVCQNLSAISDDVDQAKQAAGGGSIPLHFDASIGAGLLVALVGCVLAAIGSFMLLRQKDAAPA
jgi:hypothetical protein